MIGPERLEPGLCPGGYVVHLYAGAELLGAWPLGREDGRGVTVAIDLLGLADLGASVGVVVYDGTTGARHHDRLLEAPPRDTEPRYRPRDAQRGSEGLW